MSGTTEVSVNAVFVQIEAGEDSFVSVLPPYMSPKRWALIIDKTERAVKADLQKGNIARYQPTEGGKVMVNVYQEIEKAKNAPAY